MTSMERLSVISDKLQKSVDSWLSLSLWDKIDNIPDLIGSLEARSTFIPLSTTDEASQAKTRVLRALQTGLPILESRLKRNPQSFQNIKGVHTDEVKAWITTIHNKVFSPLPGNQETVDSVCQTWAGHKVAPFVMGMGTVKQVLFVPSASSPSTPQSREWYNAVQQSIDEKSSSSAWKMTAPVLARLPGREELPTEVGSMLDVLTLFIVSLGGSMQPESKDQLESCVKELQEWGGDKEFPLSRPDRQIWLMSLAKAESERMNELLS